MRLGRLRRNTLNNCSARGGPPRNRKRHCSLRAHNARAKFPAESPRRGDSCKRRQCIVNRPDQHRTEAERTVASRRFSFRPTGATRELAFSSDIETIVKIDRARDYQANEPLAKRTCICERADLSIEISSLSGDSAGAAPDAGPNRRNNQLSTAKGPEPPRTSARRQAK